MAVRKHEIERSKARVQSRIKKVIDNSWFRENVKIARELLQVNKDARDVWYSKILERKGGIKEATRAPEALPQGWHPFKEEKTIGIEDDVVWNRTRAIAMLYKRLPIEHKLSLKTIVLLLASDGIPVTETLFFASLCHDFEGTERQDFIAYISPLVSPATVHYWYSPMAPLLSYKDWQKTSVMRPNRIYLDVTRANLDDVQAQWYEIQEIQNRLKIFTASKGRPQGTIDTSLDRRDKRLYEIYQNAKTMLEKKGVKKLCSGRYEGIYDMVSKIYWGEMRLQKSRYLSPATVKRIIAKQKRQSIKNHS